jgi:hypothetical protein
MKHEFSKVREFLANLVGNPNASPEMGAALEKSIQADEAAIAEIVGSAGSASPPATPEAANQQLKELALSGALPADPAFNATEFLQKFNAIEQKVTALAGENQNLIAQNRELIEFKNSVSPAGIVGQNENGTLPVTTSKTAEKDAAIKANIERLVDKYPSLMQEFI